MIGVSKRLKNAVTTFTYRWLTKADATACADADATLLNQVIWIQDDFLRRLRNKRYHYIGAFDGDTLIGYAGIRIITKFKKDISILLDNLAVATLYQRQGVARELMNRVVKHANVIGPGLPMKLEVVASNDAAVELYRTFGFDVSLQTEFKDDVGIYKTIPLPLTGSVIVYEMMKYNK